MIEFPDAADYDAAVAEMDGVDRWCTSTDWVLPLTSSMGANDPFVVRTASGWGLFDRAETPDGGRVVLGMDRVWGFASAIVGPPPAWGEVLAEVVEEPWSTLLIPGLAEGSPEWTAVAAAADAVGLDLFRAGGITRQRADLRDGFAAWLARRSARFTRQVRRIVRHAADAGIRVVPTDPVTPPAELLERLVAIERRSWKGAEADGLCAPAFAEFYLAVLERLATAGRVRCLIARQGETDVGYIVGGVRDDTYRGLQLSYAADRAALSVGHLLQYAQIERLCTDEPAIAVYDLGMDIDYKRRWADDALTTTVIAGIRR